MSTNNNNDTEMKGASRMVKAGGILVAIALVGLLIMRKKGIKNEKKISSPTIKYKINPRTK